MSLFFSAMYNEEIDRSSETAQAHGDDALSSNEQ